MTARSSRARPRSSWTTRILAVLVKEFMQLTRDRLTYAMILAMPVVQLMLFGYAINTEPRHLPTAVLVQDDRRFARSTLAALDNSQLLRHHAPGAHAGRAGRAAARRARCSSRSPSPATSRRRVARGDKRADPGRGRRHRSLGHRRGGGGAGRPARAGAGARPDGRAGAARGRRRRRSRWSCTAATIPRPSPPTTSCRACWASSCR